MIIDAYIVWDFPLMGDLTWFASPDHATLVTSYTATVFVQGTTTVQTTIPLGKPVPGDQNICTLNIASALNALPAGNYDIQVNAVGPGGTTPSPTLTNDFTVPLIPGG